MRKTTLALTVLFVAAAAATGQTSDAELTRLRERLDLPGATVIVTSKSSKFPAGSPLNIYVATGQERRAYERITKWIDKWNKGDGKQFGGLLLAPDAAHADVILARYTVREDASVLRRTTIDIGPGRDPTARPATRARAGTNLYTALPLYSYLITRTPNALLIVYRNVDRSHIEDRGDPDGRLLSELGRRLKGH
jgi:hypothetical protein